MRLVPFAAVALLALGCEEVPAEAGGGGEGGQAADGGGGEGGAPISEEGTPLSVELGAEPVYIDLETLAPTGVDTSWDLAFDGTNVLTNGGVSGEKQGAAFGPLSSLVFLADTIPEHPFLVEDRAGGAFLEWYEYDGTNHALYSRYHVQGVRRGDAFYKVQILGYYGEIEGAPVSAVYQLRYAEVTPDGPGDTIAVENLDATAGGASGDEDAPSRCLILATGEQLELTPAEVVADATWDLCFRRDLVSVNGGEGGPGGVTAIDLHAGETLDETLEEIMERTADSEEERFDAIDYDDLTKRDLVYTGDGVVSAFTGRWIEPGSSPPAPEPDSAWLVAAADGVAAFLIVFESITSGDAGLERVEMRVKRLDENF